MPNLGQKLPRQSGIPSRLWVWIGIFILLWLGLARPVAARIDTYVNQYLRVSGPVELPLDAEGHTLTFTPEQLTDGKNRFQSACLNCHVGGATLPAPNISLSLKDLRGATPPRDTIQALVEYQRDPLSYDGSDFSYGCRPVPPSWMDDEALQNLAAFILRAAQVAPGWGANDLMALRAVPSTTDAG
ncbi:photosystem II cytochrome PsbV2 [Synechococcus sp. Nb3U1]|uniref:photosystem II cytochrome PsbV2 n=1 Tax=Synechococcus sp. Nb3U1 TaxID=1914529 RepID=UPI001F3BAE59|nr:photosystem II cytochrome PsbV2 [Synechococcus sp. Nb3U1]MCF2970094.1 photosystem II cytochrome PsbV2 [Synechococcus sp. Nb3U1]